MSTEAGGTKSQFSSDSNDAQIFPGTCSGKIWISNKKHGFWNQEASSINALYMVSVAFTIPYLVIFKDFVPSKSCLTFTRDGQKWFYGVTILRSVDLWVRNCMNSASWRIQRRACDSRNSLPINIHLSFFVGCPN